MLDWMGIDACHCNWRGQAMMFLVNGSVKWFDTVQQKVRIEEEDLLVEIRGQHSRERENEIEKAKGSGFGFGLLLRQGQILSIQLRFYR